MDEVQRDAHLIDSLGGPTKVAGLLGWLNPGAIQRVSNWKRRGIPAHVRLQYQALFAGRLTDISEASGQAPTPEARDAA